MNIQGHKIPAKPTEAISYKSENTGPDRKANGQKQIPPGNPNTLSESDNPIYRKPVVCVPTPLTRGVRNKKSSSNNLAVSHRNSGHPERYQRVGGMIHAYGSHALPQAQEKQSLESRKRESDVKPVVSPKVCESLLARSFLSMITMPGEGVRANDPRLQKFVQANLGTINFINDGIQTDASTAGGFRKAPLETLGQSGIQLPLSKTGKSRLATGKMGFDMKLSDALLQESFYKKLLQARGKGLEIGPGYGELCLKVLANSGVMQLDCIEPNITQLLIMQARIKDSQPGHLEKLALLHGSFPEDYDTKDREKYDFIICHRVFSVTPADMACQIMENAFRQLKPGGRLFLLSLSDEHPDFQNYIRNHPEWKPGHKHGLIEVAAKEALPGQEYNLPESITFISQSSFAEYLEKAGFIIEETSFPSTTSMAARTSDEKWKRNIAFVLKKPGQDIKDS